MTHTKKIIVILLVLTSVRLQAQEPSPRHEVTPFLGMGLSSMPFSGPVSWEDHPGLSFGFGADYTYWLNRHFGLQAGLRMDWMSHRQMSGAIDLPFSGRLPMSSVGITGGTGTTTVDMRGTVSCISEKQNYTFLELPIRLAMRWDGLYGNVGVSLAKAVEGKAEYSYDDVTYMVAALPDLGVTLPTPVPITLAGVTDGKVEQGEMYKPLFLLLGAEAGYRFDISDWFGLGAGVYGHLALPKYKTGSDNEVFPLKEETINLSQPSKTALVEKIGYYEVGIRLSAFLGLGCRGKEIEEEEPVVVVVDHVAAEKAEADRVAAEKAAQEKAEAERLVAEREARAKAEAERQAVEKAAREKAEAERLAAERAEAAAHEALEETVGKICVNFAYNSTRPLYDAETDSNLQLLCAAMQADTNMRVVVIGHTDNVGTKKNNRIVGRRRAAVVKRKLVAMGAPAQHIDIATRGEKEPIESNRTSAGRANNRRVTMQLK